MSDTNPRAVIGGNLSNDAPDFARLEVERLEQDYAQVVATADALIAEAETFPEEITVEQKDATADLIKRFRDVASRAEGLRVLEKEPHFRRGQGVDQFFFGRVIDRIMRRDKKNQPGWGDILLARLTALDTKLLREEQERRRIEAERLAEIARKAEAERLAKERAAEEARLAAERARKPETIAVKEQAAQALAEANSAARIEAEVKAAQAEEAYVATLSKPADLMRTRTAGGTLSTVAREFYAEIEDANLLDHELLWPFITLDAKEKALRLWARTTSHNVQMPGARIGSRPKSTVR